MPLDLDGSSVIFVNALRGQPPTDAQLATLDPRWSEPAQAAVDATAVNRRAALLVAKFGVDRVVAVLRGQPHPQARPRPDPTPFRSSRLPAFPDRALPGWIGNFVRAESRATQTPVDLAAMLALAVLSAACAGPIVLNPWGDWREPLNLFTIVGGPTRHRGGRPSLALDVHPSLVAR